MKLHIRLILVGGVALVAGLWTARLAPAWSIAWSLGLLVSLLGIAGLAGGIHGAIDVHTVGGRH
ncbi:MAG: hypothetical protein ABEH88_11975 [Halobacteriales archaeon]